MFEKLLLYSEEHRSSTQKLIATIMGRHIGIETWSAGFTLETVVDKRTGKAILARRTYSCLETYSVVL